MPSFDVSVDFEVFCGRCGAGLCNNSREGRTPGRGVLTLTVDPCKRCLGEEFDSGKEAG